MGWGGDINVLTTTSLIVRPDDYVLHTTLSTYMFSWGCNMLLYVDTTLGWVGWGGVGWRYQRPDDYVLDSTPDDYVLDTTLSTYMFSWRCNMLLRPCYYVGGTQCLDRAWGVLKKWLPKQLNIKKRSKGHGVVNPHLKEKTLQWLWRRNLNVSEKFTPTQMCQELGKICHWRPWVWKIKLMTPPATGHRSRRDLAG